MKLSYYIAVFGLMDRMQDCWLLEHRIFKERNCTDEEASHLVSIQFRKDNYCGGSLIKPNWVLTAAHCCRTIKLLQGYNAADIYKVRAGSPVWVADYNELYEIEDVYYHQNFSESPIRTHDVCLLKLTTDVRLRKEIQLSILATTNHFEAMMKAKSCNRLMTMGFGQQGKEHMSAASSLGLLSLDSARSVNPRAQCNTVEIIGQNMCQDKKFDDVSLGEDNICAVNPTPAVLKPCGGDSGAPAFCQGVQIGIVTAGGICGDVKIPNVYVRVDLHHHFITQLVGRLPTPGEGELAEKANNQKSGVISISSTFVRNVFVIILYVTLSYGANILINMHCFYL